MKRYRLFEIEDVLADMDTSEVDDDIAETEEDYQIVVSGVVIFVEKLNLCLRQGVVCNWDEEEKMFMPDFAVTVIYESESNCEEWIYFEQDGFVTTMANWLSGRMPVEQIEQLWCEIIMPDNNNKQKKERKSV